MKKAAVMIYPQFCMQEISCLTELFRWYDKEITVFASSKAPIKSEDGFTFLPDAIFDEFKRDEYDCVVLPGIWDFREALSDDKNISFLSQFKNDKDMVIASISSSPILLGKAGILDNHKFCSGLFEEVMDEYPVVPRDNVVRKPLCEDGNLITAIGFAFREFAIAAAKKVGIDCSEKVFDPAKENYTEEELTFHITEEFMD